MNEEQINGQEPEFVDINAAMKMMLFGQDFISALRTIQDMDKETLQHYQMSQLGIGETTSLMRDLTIFEAKFSPDFMRGLAVGIAASVTDYDKHKNGGNGVFGTLRAAIALRASKRIDVVTGKEY